MNSPHEMFLNKRLPIHAIDSLFKYILDDIAPDVELVECYTYNLIPETATRGRKKYCIWDWHLCDLLTDVYYLLERKVLSKRQVVAFSSKLLYESEISNATNTDSTKPPLCQYLFKLSKKQRKPPNRYSDKSELGALFAFVHELVHLGADKQIIQDDDEISLLKSDLLTIAKERNLTLDSCLFDEVYCDICALKYLTEPKILRKIASECSYSANIDALVEAIIESQIAFSLYRFIIHDNSERLRLWGTDPSLAGYLEGTMVDLGVRRLITVQVISDWIAYKDEVLSELNIKAYKLFTRQVCKNFDRICRAETFWLTTSYRNAIIAFAVQDELRREDKNMGLFRRFSRTKQLLSELEKEISSQ